MTGLATGRPVFHYPMGMKDLITSSGLTSLVYHAHLSTKFGKAWLEWEPETLWQAIEDEWLAPPTEGAKAAIMAVRVLLSNDDFFEDIQTFEAVVLGLNNHQPKFDRLEVAAPHEIAYAISQVNALRTKDRPEYSDDVIHYVRGSMREYGNYVYPFMLAFADPGDRSPSIEAKIKKMAKSPPKDPDDMVSVQAAKLHDLNVYIEARKAETKAVKKESDSVRPGP